jgi:hypothetical protein
MSCDGVRKPPHRPPIHVIFPSHLGQANIHIHSKYKEFSRSTSELNNFNTEAQLFCRL